MPVALANAHGGAAQHADAVDAALRQTLPPGIHRRQLGAPVGGSSRPLTIQVLEKLLACTTLHVERLFSSDDIGNTELLSLSFALRCFRTPLLSSQILNCRRSPTCSTCSLRQVNMAGHRIHREVAGCGARVEDIFDGPLYIPVVERAADVLNFMLREQLLELDHMRMLWKSSLT